MGTGREDPTRTSVSHRQRNGGSYRQRIYSEERGRGVTDGRDRAVELAQIKADDTVSALKARQLGTLTRDSHPAEQGDGTHHALITGDLYTLPEHSWSRNATVI